MTGDRADISRFRALGAVVEILERGGNRRVVVVLDSGTVIDVPLECACDLHLGDRVTVEGWLEVNAVSATARGRSGDQTSGGRSSGPVVRCWRHDG
jgi:hypothetical protein